MISIRTIGALSVFALVTACSNTAKGVKEDAAVAGDTMASAAAATSEAVGGAMQTGDVKTALLADTRLDASDINVDTDESMKTVTLKGTVRTENEKTLASQVAESHAVGYKVVNTLTIKP